MELKPKGKETTRRFQIIWINLQQYPLYLHDGKPVSLLLLSLKEGGEHTEAEERLCPGNPSLCRCISIRCDENRKESLQAFKARLDVALGSLVCWLVTLHIAGGLKLDDHCGPFQFNSILWFYEFDIGSCDLSDSRVLSVLLKFHNCQPAGLKGCPANVLTVRRERRWGQAGAKKVRRSSGYCAGG